MAACLFTGCSQQDRAVEAAKKDVTATGKPQQVLYVDGNGNTTTTMVYPAAPGGATPTVVSTTLPAGSPTPQNMPDWSNGVRPEPRHAARYKAPGVLAEGSIAPPAPGTMASAASPAMASTPAPAPVFIPANIAIPAGTMLTIRMNQRIDVKHARVGNRFTGELAENVVRDGNVVLPRGTDVRGVIDAAHRRGHFKGASILQLRLTSLVHDGQVYPISTADFVATKKGKGKRTAGWIGGTAGAGMLIGGIASGGVGLLAGGLAGGGLGTLVAGTTGNRDIVIPAEARVRFRLENDLTVQAPTTVATNEPQGQ